MGRASQLPKLPMHDGVSPSRVAVPFGHWPNVMAFLCERFDNISAEEWARRFAQGLVLNAEGHALAAHDACPVGGHVFYYRQLPLEAELPEPASILFEDELLVVADKPHFMPVTPSGPYVHNSLLVQMKQQTQCETLTPLHRIDRETAGVVVFCKRPPDRDAYHALFRQQQVHKLYEAVAPHLQTLALPSSLRCRLVEDERFFLSRVTSGEPNSETRISLRQQRDGLGMYDLEPLTGQRHQLRLHMWHLGVPILGDQFYPEVLRGPQEPDDFSQALQLLARHIAFTDPVNGEQRRWVSQRRLHMAW
jgi:tRNA pseudouridine32 synthase/23S rRNA pseudouridine746 synthase